jgi:hypothetical protein
MRGTHRLKGADGQTSKGTERISASKGHSHSREHRWTDKLRYKKNSSKGEALTD